MACPAISLAAVFSRKVKLPSSFIHRAGGWMDEDEGERRAAGKSISLIPCVDSWRRRARARGGRWYNRFKNLYRGLFVDTPGLGGDDDSGRRSRRFLYLYILVCSAYGLLRSESKGKCGGGSGERESPSTTS